MMKTLLSAPFLREVRPHLVPTLRHCSLNVSIRIWGKRASQAEKATRHCSTVNFRLDPPSDQCFHLRVLSVALNYSSSALGFCSSFWVWRMLSSSPVSHVSFKELCHPESYVHQGPSLNGQLFTVDVAYVAFA